MTSSLALLLLSMDLHAAAPLFADDVIERVQALQLRLQEPILLGISDADSQLALGLTRRPPLQGIETVLLEEQPMDTALAEAGLRCGVEVALKGRSWQLQTTPQCPEQLSWPPAEEALSTSPAVSLERPRVDYGFSFQLELGALPLEQMLHDSARNPYRRKSIISSFFLGYHPEGRWSFSGSVGVDLFSGFLVVVALSAYPHQLLIPSMEVQGQADVHISEELSVGVQIGVATSWWQLYERNNLKAVAQIGPGITFESRNKKSSLRVGPYILAPELGAGVSVELRSSIPQSRHP